MSLLPVLPDEAADGEVARMYAADRERVGYLPNYTRAFWTHPQVYAAWRQLVGAIASSMDMRLFEVATLGAARALRSTYCSLAHGQILASRYLQDGEILGLLTVVDTGDEHQPGVDPRDAAVVAFPPRSPVTLSTWRSRTSHPFEPWDCRTRKSSASSWPCRHAASSARSWTRLAQGPTRRSPGSGPVLSPRSPSGARCSRRLASALERAGCPSTTPTRGSRRRGQSTSANAHQPGGP